MFDNLSHRFDGIFTRLRGKGRLSDADVDEVLREIRGEPSTRELPVLVLSARSAEMDKLLGFEHGADDYLTKPFAFSELLARVQALIRRATAAPKPEAPPVTIALFVSFNSIPVLPILHRSFDPLYPMPNVPKAAFYGFGTTVPIIGPILRPGSLRPSCGAKSREALPSKYSACATPI